MTISNLIEMAEGSPKGWKTLWEKEKLLVTSNFSFSHSVSKRFVIHTCKNQGLFGKGLTPYYTIPHFDALKIYSCGKHCEKRRYCLLQAISSFLTMFSTLYGNHFPFKMHFNFNMSSANCFSLDQSKILLSGNRLMWSDMYWL